MNTKDIGIFIIVISCPQCFIAVRDSSARARPNINLSLPSVTGNVAVFLDLHKCIKYGG